jgi:serine/threonine protein kinase
MKEGLPVARSGVLTVVELRIARTATFIEVLGADLDREDPFFVMPLADRTLKREMGRPGAPFAVREAWARDVFCAIAAAVGHAHDHDVIHRDL